MTSKNRLTLILKGDAGEDTGKTSIRHTGFGSPGLRHPRGGLEAPLWIKENYYTPCLEPSKQKQKYSRLFYCFS